MNINERITVLRKHLGLTQTEFAMRIGTSRGVIANIDNNRTEPNQVVVSAICREFGVSYAWLKDGTGEMLLEPNEDDAVNRVMLGGSDFAKLVFRQLAKLPPEAWAQFQSFVDELSSQNKKSDD